MQWHPLRLVGSHVGAPQGPVHLSPRFSESCIFEEIPERGRWGNRTASGLWAGCSSCSDYTHPLWARSQALPRVLLPRAGEEHTREGERPSTRRQGTPQQPQTLSVGRMRGASCANGTSGGGSKAQKAFAALRPQHSAQSSHRVCWLCLWAGKDRILSRTMTVHSLEFCAGHFSFQWNLTLPT